MGAAGAQTGAGRPVIVLLYKRFIDDNAKSINPNTN